MAKPTTDTIPPQKTDYTMPKTDMVVEIITLGFIWDFILKAFK